MFQFKNTDLKAQFIGFSGGERQVQLSQLPVKRPISIHLRTDLIQANDILDLLLLDNALTEYYQQQISFNLVIPYLPYARQDRVCAKGQAFSLKVFAQLLRLLKIENLMVWDVHSPISLELTQAQSISSIEIIRKNKPLSALLSDSKSLLICPDKGAKKRTLAIQRAFAVKNIIQASKIRDPKTGQIIKTEIEETACLQNKTAIITDDICDGGMTFIKIAEILKARGVKRVVLYVTHGIFSQGLAVFDGLIDAIFTTDSFPQQPHPKLTIINGV